MVGFRLYSEERMHRTCQGMSLKRGFEGKPFKVSSKIVGWGNRVDGGSVYQGGGGMGRTSLWQKIKSLVWFMLSLKCLYNTHVDSGIPKEG